MSLDSCCTRCSKLLNATWKAAPGRDDQYVEEPPFTWEHGALGETYSDSDICTSTSSATRLSTMTGNGVGQQLLSFFKTLEELASNDDDCHLCTTIFRTLSESFRNRKFVNLVEIPLEEFHEVHLFVSLHRDGYSYKLCFKSFHTRLHWLELHTSIGAYVLQGSETPSRLSPVDGVGDDTVEQIKRWMQDCQVRHGECGDYKAGIVKYTTQEFIPSRLLEVMGGTHIQLREKEALPREGNVEYATLSHCWGGQPTTHLTQELYQESLRAKPINKLPITFQDAAVMASKLGIRYLWIDALCIIQDSPEDWRRESAVMADVYSDSVLNLAASYSPDCNGGLFGQSQDLQDINPPVVSIAWNGNVEVKQKCILVERGFWLSRVLWAGLNKRGWVFQENLLSSRVVYFAWDQVLWGCRCSRGCELTPILPDSLADWAYSDQLNLQTGRWIEMVSTYRWRALTVATDVFAALGGISRIWAGTHGYTEEDFLMGLWKPNLASQLLWRTLDESKAPQHPLAPSWSWASISSQPTELFATEADKDFVHPKLTILNGEPGYPVEDSYVEPKVRTLHLSSFMFRITIRRKITVPRKPVISPKGECVSSHVDVALSWRTLMAREVASCHWKHFNPILDDETHADQAHALFVPLVFTTPRVGVPETVHGLLLRRVGASIGVYERIGLLQISPGAEGSAGLHNLPEWWSGDCLSEGEYKSDRGNGCYEIEIV